MNDLRERGNYPLEPSVIETHNVTDDYGNRLYNVTAVQSQREMNTPTWFAASDTATVTKVPRYGIPTSEDRINALTQQVDALRREIDELKRGQAVTIAGLEAYIRDHSESDDVPFAMAEDAWGVA